MQTSQEKNKSVSHKNSTSRADLLEIDRTFHVPVERLFAAFSSAEAIKAWWWPKDLFTDHVELDFREGGRYFINMKGYEQGGGGMTGKFEEIVPNRLLVMTDRFADENGRAISAKEAKMPGEWPEMVYITFEFKSLSKGSSRFHLSQEGIPNELQKDCIQGWSQSFDKLEKYLNEAK